MRGKGDSSVRPSLEQLIYPVEGELGVQQHDELEEANDESRGHDRDNLEEIAEKYEELKAKVEQYFDDTNGHTKDKVLVMRVLEKPTKEECLRHQATHTPFAPWCKHFLAARTTSYKHAAKGRRAVVARDAGGMGGKLAKVSIDYIYLHERAGTNKETRYNPPQHVMVDHGSGRVWAYRVPNKGIMDGASWLPKRIVQDPDNCGYIDVRIQHKSDQELAIVNMQIAIQNLRPQTVPTNSPVGESESNGRVENAIRRVKEKVRILRHQLECGLQRKVQDDAPIMSWLMRWAGEVISKYSTGDDRKIAYERIRGELCVVPVMPFGDIVMYLPLRRTKHNKGEATRQMGVWLGTVERAEETFIGITRGIIKCRSVNRLPEDERWSCKCVTEMQGVPWEFVPGRFGQHILVEIGREGQVMDEVEENMTPTKEDIDEDEQEREYAVKAHNLHISRKAINKYGTIEGWPASRIIERRGHLTGRIEQ